MKRKNKSGCYLVCKEHINEIKEFLSQFFDEVKGEYNFSGWITFKTPNSDFIINLMKGKNQELTQNMTFEIYFWTKKELEKFAKEHNCRIKSFEATGSSQRYRYNYVEILGPKNICKIEASYSEDIK